MFFRKIILAIACVMLLGACFKQSDDAGLLRYIVAEPSLTGQWVVHEWGRDESMPSKKGETLRVSEVMIGNHPAYKVVSDSPGLTLDVEGPVTFFRLGNSNFMYTGYPSDCEECNLLRYEVVGDSFNAYTLNTTAAAAYLEKINAPRDSIFYSNNSDTYRIVVERFDAQGVRVLEDLARNSALWSLHVVLKRN